jgi:solute carrier family 9 (sodium/hydrogen exchanger), member 6/7
MNTSNHPILTADGEKVSVYFYLIFLLMMLFFFVGSAIIEKFKPRYGHETGFTILFGVVVSLIIYASVGTKVTSTFQFSSNLFFNFFLPPIIFNSGFNMRKKKFFDNLGNVAIFGLCVTLVCWIIYSVFSILVMNIGP